MKTITRKRLFDIIEIGHRDDKISRHFDYFIAGVIFVNLGILILQTFSYPEAWDLILTPLEYLTVGIFIVEYILRLLTSQYLYPNLSPGGALVRYIFSFYGLIDLFTILPYFLLIFPAGIAAFRVLRVIRVFRLFKINSQYDAFNVVLDVLKNKRSQLISSITLILIMMIASSLLMYSIEHPVQPEIFRNAFSGLWWSVSAIFTVGYGDIYPITPLGQLLAIVISFLGIGLVAIPTGIISAGFVEQFTNAKSLPDFSQGRDLTFIMLSIEDHHPWVNQPLHQIVLPPELIVVTIVRDGEIHIPRGNTKIHANDKIVLGALEFQSDIGITVREETILPDHRWANRKLSEIAFPETIIVAAIIRNGKVIIPNGSSYIHPGDFVTFCEKKKS